MKRFFLFLFLLFFPLTVFAHGGFQKQTGEVTLYVHQEPLSPLIDEEVKFTLEFFRDDRPMQNLDVKLTLIDTFFGDETKDQAILAENKLTGVNGSFDFVYTFDKENYFDIDLNFTDPVTKEQLNTGFLVQPRYRASTQMLVLINSAAFVIICLVVYRLFKIKHS